MKISRNIYQDSKFMCLQFRQILTPTFCEKLCSLKTCSDNTYFDISHFSHDLWSIFRWHPTQRKILSDAMIGWSVTNIRSRDLKIQVRTSMMFCDFQGKGFSHRHVEIWNGMLPKFFKIVFVCSKRQRTIPGSFVQFQQFFSENEKFVWKTQIP